MHLLSTLNVSSLSADSLLDEGHIGTLLQRASASESFLRIAAELTEFIRKHLAFSCSMQLPSFEEQSDVRGRTYIPAQLLPRGEHCKVAICFETLQEVSRNKLSEVARNLKDSCYWGSRLSVTNVMLEHDVSATALAKKYNLKIENDDALLYTKLTAFVITFKAEV